MERTQYDLEKLIDKYELYHEDEIIRRWCEEMNEDQELTEVPEDEINT